MGGWLTTDATTSTRRRRSPRVTLPLRLATAAALGVDAYVHADLASAYDEVPGVVSMGGMFRIEAAVACLAAVLLLLFDNRLAWVVSFLVSASALGAVLLYGFVNVGRLGPLPDMYDPLWTTEKLASVGAEAFATIISVVGFVVAARRRRGRTSPRPGG